MKTINSTRRFVILGLCGGIPMDTFSYYLPEFLDPENDTELAYSMQENLDKILNLNVGDSLLMYCNRDAKNGSNSIIVYRNK